MNTTITSRIIIASTGLLSLAGQINAKEQPNILWITCEDISPTIGCYGDQAAKTPVIDQLASEGVRYTHVFATAGVCAPSRSTIITGVYAPSLGTHHMRTGNDISGISKGIYPTETGIIDPEGNSVPKYSAVIPSEVRCFPELLRKAGYYCTNNAKTDYQFAAPISAWDENDSNAHWRNRPKDKPFFAVFNLNVSHESMIWKKKNDPLLINKNAPNIPPYFPENKVIRQDVARNYSNIAELDKQVGQILKQLKEDGLLEKTIIFFFSDHGGPLPRGKREIYDSGLRVPFIARFPHRFKAGTVSEELISFVDLAPSMLSLAGITPPDYMQGQAFLGVHKSDNARTEIFAARDRLDECYDMVRCVRTKDYMYVKNFYPEKPNYMDLKYRRQMDMMNELIRLHKSDSLNAVQEIWFHKTKSTEEFYKVKEDPHQVQNLITDSCNQLIVEDLRKKLTNWQQKINDQGFIPEGEMVLQMWPNLKQPQTLKPAIEKINNTFKISCPTQGASIVFQFSNSGASKPEWKHWHVYSEPITAKKGQYLHIIASRIGFKQSEEFVIKCE
ncbi:sulfatase [Sunxiuqinia elliptica]|uniref:Arylsulfatase A-like enzyme n=1 Tax=Sunxiuqinia elliptica TaxID=655355 RepID=A0A4R6GPU2_9BACT|nr:sulfatase [Sunxiuqinia elliptica]TDN96640.1 arylsulfatase A-like enzyme [Sunxiuqinia elliptica]TDO55801.1 arylsulfatase A-like enzyme [Sunxiuqinia elliptica]